MAAGSNMCRGRRSRKRTGFHAAAIACGFALLFSDTTQAQELEPRSYINTPIGLNFLLVGAAYQDGDMLLDPNLLAEDANNQATSLVVGYLRSFDMFGKLAKFSVGGAYTDFHAEGIVEGEQINRKDTGFNDPGFKLSVNLVGSPAYTLKEFRKYDKEQFILGVGLAVSAPWGEYDPEKLVNIGFNRWAVKPELGMSKMWGRWIVEGSFAVAFFTDNDNYLEGQTRKREPLGSAQLHVVYRIKPGGFWIALDGTHFRGGQTSVDGVDKDDELKNNRFGFTLAVPINIHHSVKFYASDGFNSRRGSEYGLVGLAWQYRWGAGL